MEPAEIRSWVRLTTISGLGPVKTKRLIDLFGTPANIFSGLNSDLCNIEGIDKALRGRILESEDKGKIDSIVEKLKKNGINLLAINDTQYPESLKNIYAPPVLLYFKGDISILNENSSIAIVGSRRPSLYGISITKKLTCELVERGFVIISGLAAGIDTVAHKTALKFNAKTVAVLGSGIDNIYPKENKDLAKELSVKGLLLSEFPLGTEPYKENFPMRNRIISGLSKAVLIPEAGKKSGALITANFALDGGKDVFCVPGRIDSLLSEGTNKLIKEGAKLVSDIEDITEEMPEIQESLRKSFCSETKENYQDKKYDNFSKEEIKILSLIKTDPLHIDEIVSLSNAESIKVNSLLLNLQIKKAIQKLPGNFFMRSESWQNF